jgi:Tol biopolymer transport system component
MTLGIVYKAEDTKLDRIVALKFLPPHISANDEEKKRFIHEAKAASSLDHPNICTIHEIGETEPAPGEPGGQLFIAMAYYEGETLKKKIENAPLKIEEAIDIAIQVIQGLTRAHEADIVHRDIKPANIMITDRDEVKIVDFGLAKAAGQTRLTKTSTTLGTVAYMSPEQGRGEPADNRTDIWSSGVVLYEMLTGKLPFKGDYEQSIMYSIMNEEPEPITGLRTGVPMEVERIVNKCLEKSRDERYQSATDLLVDLKKLRKGLEKSETGPVAVASGELASQQRKGVSVTRIAVPGLVLILALAAYFVFRPKDSLPRFSNPRQVTSAIGVEAFPTWSPAGDQLAFHSRESGNWDIWVVQPGKSQPVNRTENNSGADRWPSWSPDGSQIIFWSRRDNGTKNILYSISAIGGNAQRIYRPPLSAGQQPQWSLDGSEIAFMSNASTGTGHDIEIYSLPTGKSQRVHFEDGCFNSYDLHWSSDGQLFAFRCQGNSRAAGRIWLLRREDEKLIRIPDHDRAFSPQFSADGRFLYFTSRKGGVLDLWRQRLEQDGTPIGLPKQVTTGLRIRHAYFSPDESRLAYTDEETVANIWSVRIPGPSEPPVKWADAQQVTFIDGEVDEVAISPDGKDLYFTASMAWKRGQVWKMPVDGGQMQQLSDDQFRGNGLSVSPDGQTLALNGSGQGRGQGIFLLPVTGGRPTFLYGHKGGDWMPHWSPDGKEIVFFSAHSGNAEIYVVSVDDRKLTMLTEHSKYDGLPRWSPDGQWIAFHSSRSGSGQIWRIPAKGGESERITQNAGYSRLKWSPDGKKLYFQRRSNIWEVSLDDKTERQLTDLSIVGSASMNEYATDGRYFYFIWQKQVGDIWVMDVE